MGVKRFKIVKQCLTRTSNNLRAVTVTIPIGSLAGTGFLWTSWVFPGNSCPWEYLLSTVMLLIYVRICTYTYSTYTTLLFIIHNLAIACLFISCLFISSKKCINFNDFSPFSLIAWHESFCLFISSKKCTNFNELADNKKFTVWVFFFVSGNFLFSLVKKSKHWTELIINWTEPWTELNQCSSSVHSELKNPVQGRHTSHSHPPCLVTGDGDVNRRIYDESDEIDVSYIWHVTFFNLQCPPE